MLVLGSAALTKKMNCHNFQVHRIHVAKSRGEKSTLFFPAVSFCSAKDIVLMLFVIPSPSKHILPSIARI